MTLIIMQNRSKQVQGKQLKKLEAHLWISTDQFIGNSKLTASEYSILVKQAHWLTSRFPSGVFGDVERLCRYVGVDTVADDDIDYEKRLNEIHIEVEGLNEEAVQFAQTISKNSKELTL